MAVLTSKQFITDVFIHEVGKMIEEKHYYLSFMIMGIGVEYLGKALIDDYDWNKDRVSSECFEYAIKNLESFKDYKLFLKGSGEYDLYGSLRCGLAHAAAPKYEITLSSQDERGHLVIEDGRLNLKCECFYSDFMSACKEVITLKEHILESKINKPFISVPGKTFNEYFVPSTGAPTSHTSSLSSEISSRTS
jgi:hypothetical protein